MSAPDYVSTRHVYGPKTWNSATDGLLRTFAFELRADGTAYAYAESALNELARRESVGGAS